MINSMQAAIIGKDIRGITSNRNLLLVTLIVPLFIAVVLPAVFVLIILFAPEDSSDMQELMAMLPGVGESLTESELRGFLLRLVLDSVLPMFFLIIPIMASTVMAASSFVGEKEKRTLETLLYSPLSLRQTFNAKIIASFILSQFVSFVSFFAMTLVVQTIIGLISGSLLLPGLNWLVLMLILSPAISLVAISLIVRGSAKAKSVEEAYQKSVMLVLPIVIIIFGQFSGLVSVGVWLLLGISVVCAVIGLILLRRSSASFHYERLLL